MRRLASFVGLTLIFTAVLQPLAQARRSPHADAPFITTARPYLIATDPGTTITPILTSGEIIGGRLGGSSSAGCPTGSGLAASATGRLEVFVNHETAYEWGDASDARVPPHIERQRQGGLGGLPRRRHRGVPVLLLEHAGLRARRALVLHGGGMDRGAQGGLSIAVNAVSGRIVETPQFGHLNHENVVPIKGLDRAVTFLAEDSFRLRSQARVLQRHVRQGDQRQGSFTVWVPDDPGDPSADDIAVGDTLDGRFVTIPRAARYSGLELNEVAEALGSFNFVRIEDAAHDPGNPGVIYVSDTGANKSETKNGRLYRLTVDPANPRRASLEVVLDGDAATTREPGQPRHQRHDARDPGGSQQGVVRLRASTPTTSARAR